MRATGFAAHSSFSFLGVTLHHPQLSVSVRSHVREGERVMVLGILCPKDQKNGSGAKDPPPGMKGGADALIRVTSFSKNPSGGWQAEANRAPSARGQGK